VAEGQLFEQLDVAKVSPFIFENHELVGYLLIPLLLPSSVFFEDFWHKFSTAKEFLNTVFNYPTFAECYKVAALNASNKLARVAC